MQRVLSLAMAGVFVLLVSAQAQAQTYNFTAALHGGNELPAVSTGRAPLRLDSKTTRFAASSST